MVPKLKCYAKTLQGLAKGIYPVRISKAGTPFVVVDRLLSRGNFRFLCCVKEIDCVLVDDLICPHLAHLAVHEA